MDLSDSRLTADTLLKKRTRLVRQYPTHTLEESKRIAEAIHESNAGLPIDRVLLAGALGTTPASSGFTMKLNSSSKYGLTNGGYSDERITLTPRGEAVVAPQHPEERRKALLDAALQPEQFRRFYEMLHGKSLPEDAYVQDMLQREIGIHASLTDECFRILKANGLYVGIISDVSGARMLVNTAGHDGSIDQDQGAYTQTPGETAVSTEIFVGHAGNKDVADLVTGVLEPFGIQNRIVECDFDASRPVSSEVAEQMRGCSAAVMVFASPTDDAWRGRREEKRAQKLLYQLGAASVLYEDRIILLKEEGADSAVLDSGFEALKYDPKQTSEVGLSIITALHRMGVIEVRA